MQKHCIADTTFFILKALNLLCKSLSYISPCRLNREFIVKENVSQLCHVFVEGRRKPNEQM